MKTSFQNGDKNIEKNGKKNLTNQIKVDKTQETNIGRNAR